MIYTYKERIEKKMLLNKYFQNKYYENGNHKFFQKQKKREKNSADDNSTGVASGNF